MRPSGASAVPLSPLVLLIAVASSAAPATWEVRSGPPVGSEYDLVPFHAATGDPALYIAWRDPRSDLASGVFHLDEGTFDAFPTLAGGALSNITVGTGGSAEARRAYVTWVNAQMRITLAVFDPDGNVVREPHEVASSVQVSRQGLVGTNAGVLVGHVWDTGPYWDPRILEVDAWGNVLGLEVADQVGSPEQTLGATLAGEPSGSHAIAYITSDSHLVRLRRYSPTGPLDPLPVVVSGDASADYLPLSTVFAQGTPPVVLLTFPWDPTGGRPGARFAAAPLSNEAVTLGPVLSDLVPGFVGRVSDISALAGPQPRAAVVWQEVEFEDPETCLCSVPPPIRVDFFALVLALGPPIVAEGEPVLVHRWVAGDPVGPPITEPRLAVASDSPGQFTVVWSDGVLRYFDVALPAVAVDEPASRTSAPSLASRPNPFSGTTTIEYSLPQQGPLCLAIVDARGRVVVRFSRDAEGAPRGSVSWDGRDSDGRSLPAGIYYARLEAPGVVESRKLVLSR